MAVACGQNHCLALCESGHVFAWGAGDDGQLGLLAGQVYSSHKPRQGIKSFDDTYVCTHLIHLYIFNYFCLSLCSMVPIPIPLQIIQVACGNSHSLALSKGKTLRLLTCHSLKNVFINSTSDFIFKCYCCQYKQSF